jgi:hypothetical protein
MKTIRLFYIGDDFYRKSSTMMSSIYIENTKERFDWSFVEVELKRGNDIHIRPATKEEMEWAHKELDITNKSWDNLGYKKLSEVMEL